MKKTLIFAASISVALLLVWNMGTKHVRGVKAEKEWYISQLKFDFFGTLDSAEKKGQALIYVTNGTMDVNEEARLKKELRFNGRLDLFLYRHDGKIDLRLLEDVPLKKGDSVNVSTNLKTARFFRNGKIIYEQPLLKSLRGRPF